MIALATGGTGGHVFPAEALARDLGARGYRLVLITDQRGTKFGGALDTIERHMISASAISGRGLLARIGAAASLFMGLLQARGLMRRLRPSAVVGFGGYPSVPTMMAAGRVKGVRTIIHEQNAVLGRANRLLAPRMDRIATSFERTDLMRDAEKPKTVWTGNPVRPEIAALSGRDWTGPKADGPFNLLIVGGSQGAQVFGTMVPDAIERLDPALRARLSVVQQAREGQLDAVRERYAALGVKAEVSSFFSDMPDRLLNCHLVICRAGASTIAELITAGRPAILIPYPHAIDDHQTQNAARLSDAGGGWMLPERDLTPETLASRLSDLMTGPATLNAAAAAARRIAMPDAARNLGNLVVDVINGVERSPAGTDAETAS